MICMICSHRSEKIDELEKKIIALTDMYKSISIQCAANHEHKIRQIDENRKVSKHLDNIDSSIRVHWDDREYFYQKIKELKNSDYDERIDMISLRLDRIDHKCVDSLNALQKKTDELEQYMEMEDRVTASDILIRLNQLEEMTLTEDEMKNFVKKPYKCPVCNGVLKNHYYSSTDPNNTLLLDCKSCDGKGIVWG